MLYPNKVNACVVTTRRCIIVKSGIAILKYSRKKDVIFTRKEYFEELGADLSQKMVCLFAEWANSCKTEKHAARQGMPLIAHTESARKSE